MYRASRYGMIEAWDQTSFAQPIYNVQDLTDGTKQTYRTRRMPRQQILQIHGAIAHKT